MEIVPKSAHMPSQASLLVDAPCDGMRLDRFLALRLEDGGRKLARLLCEQSLALVDGRPRRKSFVLSAGMRVEVRAHEYGRAVARDQPSLEVLLETAHLVAVNKPAGIPSGALLGSESGTISGALLHRYPEMAGVGFGPLEPGLVHRLDNDTSGVLLAARSQVAFVALREALEKHKLEKSYLAVVPAAVLPDSGTRKTALKPHDSDSKRVVETDGPLSFETRFKVIQRGGAFDLVEAHAHRAYRHQIRCHLAALGAPLVGDSRYGSTHLDALPERHALHAASIAGTLCLEPSNESAHADGTAAGVTKFEATAALPPELRRLVFDS